LSDNSLLNGSMGSGQDVHGQFVVPLRSAEVSIRRGGAKHHPIEMAAMRARRDAFCLFAVWVASSHYAVGSSFSCAVIPLCAWRLLLEGSLQNM